MALTERVQEEPVEARIARLESHVEHIQADVSEIKVDLRDMRGDMKEIRGEIHSAKIWAVLLYVGLAVILLGTMARGFGWL